MTHCTLLAIEGHTSHEAARIQRIWPLPSMLSGLVPGSELQMRAGVAWPLHLAWA